MRRTRPWKQWQSAKDRCAAWNKAHKKRYFDRGISMCERWLHSFEHFWEDMKEGYRDDLTLERINNDLGYSPENCKWATSSQQADNRCTARKYQMNGEMLSVRNWERRFNLPKCSLYRRLNKGMSLETAILDVQASYKLAA